MEVNESQNQRPFEMDEIEDASIIIYSKGKHWSIIANSEKTDRDSARICRTALAVALIGMQHHIVVTPCLEEISPEYALKLIELKGNQIDAVDILKKLSDLEQHKKSFRG